MAADDVKKMMAQGRSFWASLSGGRKAVLVGAAAATLGLILYFALRDEAVHYQVLFSSLAPEDTDAIEVELKRTGVPYRKDPNKASLYVPTDRMAETRVALAAGGYPRKGGVGFEIFDKQSFGATGFVEQMNYRRALQGELERTISGLSAVESARVHLAIPEKTLFRDEHSQPSASVMVRMHAGRALSPAQVRGIVNFISFSVPGLVAENVSLVDETGRALSTQGGDAYALEAQHRLEATLTRRVQGILEKVVGEGHVSVQVTTEMDFTKSTKTEESYDPARMAVRSEQRTVDWTGSSNVGVGGLAGSRASVPAGAGAAANVAVPPAPTTIGTTTPTSPTSPPGVPPSVGFNAQGPGGGGKMMETRNFEVSKTVATMQDTAPQLKRIHIAVLADGMPDPNFKPNPKKKELTPPRIPLGEVELKRLVDLTTAAIGLDKTRGDTLEIQSATFAPVPSLSSSDAWEQPLPAWLRSPGIQLVLKGVGLVLCIILGMAALAIFIRSFRMRREELVMLKPLPRPVADVESEFLSQHEAREIAPSPPPIQLPPPVPEIRARDLAAEAAKRDVQRATRVVANWLTETSR